MKIENSFSVGASPDAVFAFLLDVNRVVSCVPGAELSEVVDPDTFRGKVRIKVGPVTVSYNGTAHITERDATARRATLQAEGRETTGSGSARATTTMSVAPDGDGSAVHFATEFTVVGRVAQFGRGIMEEVSRKLVGQMGDCIRANFEAQTAPPPATPASDGGAPGNPAATATATLAATATTAAPPPSIAAAPTQAAPTPPAATVPVDALALARSMAGDRIRAAGAKRLAGIAAGLVALVALFRRLRRRRRHS